MCSTLVETGVERFVRKCQKSIWLQTSAKKLHNFHGVSVMTWSY